ncbi:MAG TPA: hypothetical protein PK530_03380 [Anaerolineales bacterium]|nr:hypothetical protein [Anaerolineales bacterium]
MSWGLGFLFVVWVGGVIFLRYYRVWLFYYLLGTVGCAYWLALGVRNVWGIEPLLAQSVAQAVHLLAGLINVPTVTFSGAPGVLLVMVVAQEVGWTVLQVGVESSGLLEMSTLLSLVVFYPGFSLRQKAFTLFVGLLATWFANVVRLFLIVTILNHFGKESLILAHTYLGKLVFFAFTILIYWLLITSQTLTLLRKKYTATPTPVSTP